jgi:non-specific serine/threonine protein kinase
VGAELIDEFPDGAWLIDLARLGDPSAVPRQIADALAVAEQPGRAIESTLVDHLRASRLLLILDNCEHLIDASAQIADQILASCADVRILATSREALNVPGERTYRLRSLTLPDEDDPALDQIAGSESVQLFCQRVRAARSDFDLDETNAKAVSQICVRLDGLPLAVELAAARCREMSPQEVAERLDDRFRLLTGGSRLALPRQRTLEATVAWSYELLSPSEQRIFERLSVFAGSCSLEAAERVCADDEIEAPVVDLMANLVDRSLVAAEPSFDGRMRYRLLETLRQFGRDRLLARGDLGLTRDRHLAWMVDHAPTLPPQVGTNFPIEIEVDDGNIRAAIEWAIETGNSAAGLHIVAAVWTVSSRLAERLRWYSQLLDGGADQVPSGVAARAFAAAGGIAFMLGEWTLAVAHFNGAIGAAIVADDQQIHAMSLAYAGSCHAALGEPAKAYRLLHEALDLAMSAADEEMVRRALVFLAWFESERDLDAALDHAQRADASSREGGTPFDLSHSREVLGFIHALRGDLDRAASLFTESLDLVAVALAGCAAHALETVAAWTVMVHRSELGAELVGAADRIREETGDQPRPWERRVREDYLPKLREVLGDEPYEEAYAKGARLSREEALTYAAHEIGASTHR